MYKIEKIKENYNQDKSERVHIVVPKCFSVDKNVESVFLFNAHI